MDAVFFWVVLTVFVLILLVLHYVVFIFCMFSQSVFYFMSVHSKVILDKRKFKKKKRKSILDNNYNNNIIWNSSD